MWAPKFFVNLSCLLVITVILPNDELIGINIFSGQKGTCVQAFVINPTSSLAGPEKKQPFTKADWAHEDSYDYFALEPTEDESKESKNQKNDTDSSTSPSSLVVVEKGGGDGHEVKSRSLDPPQTESDLWTSQVDNDENNEIEPASSAQAPGFFLFPQFQPVAPHPPPAPHGINHLEKVGERLNHFISNLGGKVHKHMGHVNASLGILSTGIAVGANGLQNFITNASAKTLSTIQAVLDRIGYFFHTAITRIRTIFDTLRAGIHNLIQSVIGPGHKLGGGHPPPPPKVVEKVVEPARPIILDQHPPPVPYGIDLEQPVIHYSTIPLDA